LSKGNDRISLTPKQVETLLILVQNKGQVLEKDTLMKRLWPNTVVEEANLTTNISALRKALGIKRNERRYIITHPNRGYSFVDDGPEVIFQQRTTVTIEREEETTEEESKPEPNKSKTFRERMQTATTARKVIVGTVLAVIAMVTAFLIVENIRHPRMRKSFYNIKVERAFEEKVVMGNYL